MLHGPLQKALSSMAPDVVNAVGDGPSVVAWKLIQSLEMGIVPGDNPDCRNSIGLLEVEHWNNPWNIHGMDNPHMLHFGEDVPAKHV